MKGKKPKYLVKSKSWFGDERATNTGEWPFTFTTWKVTFYPYTHDNDGTLIWLEPDIEHIHTFIAQSVGMHSSIPLFNKETMMFDQTEDLPFCRVCGVFMEPEVWQHFMKCKEMVKLSVDKQNEPA